MAFFDKNSKFQVATFDNFFNLFLIQLQLRKKIIKYPPVMRSQTCEAVDQNLWRSWKTESPKLKDIRCVWWISKESDKVTKLEADIPQTISFFFPRRKKKTRRKWEAGNWTEEIKSYRKTEIKTQVKDVESRWWIFKKKWTYNFSSFLIIMGLSSTVQMRKRFYGL